MKNLLYFLFLLIALSSCGAEKIKKQDENLAKVFDTVRIANDSLEYEVIIIDAGFSSWMNGRSKPRGYYGIDYLENRNQLYVTE